MRKGYHWEATGERLKVNGSSRSEAHPGQCGGKDECRRQRPIGRLAAAGLHALRDEYTRTIEPARALAAETLTPERTLSDLVNQAYALPGAPGPYSYEPCQYLDPISVRPHRCPRQVRSP